MHIEQLESLNIKYWFFSYVNTEAPPAAEFQYINGSDRRSLSQFHFQTQGNKLMCSSWCN